MADDPNEDKRWVPWSREKDAKAQLIAAVFGLLTAVVVSGTGYLRVDKFGLSDHLRSVKEERLITEAQIAAAIRKREQECVAVKAFFEERLDAIEKMDTMMNETMRSCQGNLQQINEKVDYFQRKYWENNAK